MNKETYKYLIDNTTKTYKKANRVKVNRINFEAKKIAKKLAIDETIKQMEETEAFITVTDHKESFPNSPIFQIIHQNRKSVRS